MILSALLAGVAAAQAPTAADFFPLTPGTKWTYEVLSQDRIEIKEVGLPVDIGGAEATPIVSKTSKGRVIATEFYRIVGNTVYLVANDAKVALPKPQPIFMVGPKKQKWRFDSTVSFDGEMRPIRIDGESELKPAQKVLSQTVDTISVKLSAQIQQDSKTTIDYVQTATYAVGIGYVGMVQTSKVGKLTQTDQIDLIKFEPGKQGAG